MGVIFMAKYGFKFKLKLVLEYLAGNTSYASLADKYNMPDSTPIKKWVDAYKINGRDALLRSRKRKEYSFHFKLHAVQLYLKSETSYTGLAFSLGMKEPSVLTQWVNRYRASGVDGLRPRNPGRKYEMKKQEISKADPSVAAAAVQKDYIKKLEQENLYLRIENDYLKEVRRLRLEEEARKRQQESSTVSEDPTD